MTHPDPRRQLFEPYPVWWDQRQVEALEVIDARWEVGFLRCWCNLPGNRGKLILIGGDALAEQIILGINVLSYEDKPLF